MESGQKNLKRKEDALRPPPPHEPPVRNSDASSPLLPTPPQIIIDNVFSQMPAILWSVDRSLTVTSSLGGGLKGINVRPYELIGKSLLEYLGTTDIEHPEVIKHKLVLEGQSFTFESDIQGCILSCHMEPLRDHDGQITGCIGIALDVTKVRRLQLTLLLRNRILEITSSDRPMREKFTVALQLLEELYVGMHGSVMLASADGKFLSLNSGPSLPQELHPLLDRFEISPIGGACGSAAYHLKQVIVENIATDPLFMPYRELCLGLGLRACWSQPLLSSKGRLLGTLAMYFGEPKSPDRDELEMLQWTAHLLSTAIEREQSERFINGLMQDLERSNREMSRFISIASHDLREPLRTMSAYMQQVEKKLEGHLDEQTRMDMNFVTISARRMQKMISTLTEYSRVGRRKISRNRVSMKEVIETAIQDLKALIEESGAEVTYDANAEASGDASLLARVVENLLTNAIRYRGDRAPRIRIVCSTRRAECQFKISDNGIGISMTSAADIFQLFHRLVQTRDEEGLGLGLAVCKKIIEAHGGRIWVESVPGEGSSFLFTVPSFETSELY